MALKLQSNLSNADLYLVSWSVQKKNRALCDFSILASSWCLGISLGRSRVVGGLGQNYEHLYFPTKTSNMSLKAVQFIISNE